MDSNQKELEVFLKTQLNNGVSESDLRDALKKEGGWSDEDIDSVLASARAETSPAPQDPAPEATTDTPAPMMSSEDNTVAPTPQPVVTEATDVTSTSAVMEDAMSSVTQKPSKRGGMRTVLVSIAVLVGVVALGAVGYAYVKSTGMFSNDPYTEENLLRGLLEKSALIDSATYRVEGALEMQPRDADAFPFALEEDGDVMERREAYERDAELFEHVSTLLSGLQYTPTRGETLYMSSLEDTLMERDGRGYVALKELRDLGADVPYEYHSTDNGGNFELIVTFETSDAISTISDNYNHDPSNTAISGKTVTFTKESGRHYLYLREPSKPFLVEMSEQARMLPPELNASLSVEATVDTQNTQANWEFAIDAELDMSDMMYKVAADARKVDSDYFFRVRNMPGLYTAMLGVQKGVWVKISSDEQAENNYSLLGSLTNELPEIEEGYKENRQEVADFLEKIVTYAEEERLIILKEQPVLEKVDDRSLYRYEVGLNKDALVPFVKKMITEAGKNDTTANIDMFYDTALLEHLESDEFEQTFDYLDQNTSLVIHVDTDGYLASVQSGMRLVPPDTAKQLQDKQGYLTITLTLNNINESVQVSVPEDAIPLEQLMEDYTQNFEFSQDTKVPTVVSVTANSLSAFLLLPKLFTE